MMTDKRQKPSPKCECISCGKMLESEDRNEELAEGQIDLQAPIYNGIYLRFQSDGNYGSTVFDMDEYTVEGFLCDECFLQKAHRLFACSHSSEDKVGERISSLMPEKLERDKYGPVYLSRYANGESWVRGVRSYEEVTSTQRSAAEAILMGSKEGVVSVTRELLGGLLGALRAAEHNRMEHEVEYSRVRSENETFKSVLAGEPKEAEALAILHKEAAKLSVTELQYLKEYARWGAKVQAWLDDHELVHKESGVPLDRMLLWVELTKGGVGLRKYEEQQKELQAALKTFVEKEQIG